MPSSHGRCRQLVRRLHSGDTAGADRRRLQRALRLTCTCAHQPTTPLFTSMPDRTCITRAGAARLGLPPARAAGAPGSTRGGMPGAPRLTIRFWSSPRALTSAKCGRKIVSQLRQGRAGQGRAGDQQVARSSVPPGLARSLYPRVLTSRRRAAIGRCHCRASGTASCWLPRRWTLPPGLMHPGRASSGRPE